MADNKSLYDTLGVSKDASSEEIKKAYRRLARKYRKGFYYQPFSFLYFCKFITYILS